MRYAAAVLISILSVSTLFAETKISYLTGAVSVFHGQRWIEARSGMTIPAGDRVKTVLDSKAVLLVDGTSRVWVSPNSEVEVSAFDAGNAFKLLLGKIRAKVKLLQGKKFQVRTPVAVCSVRGTEFVISSDGQLGVIEGRVEFSDIDTPQVVEVGAGFMGTVDPAGNLVPPHEMTGQEQEQMNQEFQNFGDGAGQGEQIAPPSEQRTEQPDDLRQELIEIVDQVKSDVRETREITNEIKETDISASRFMRDVNGNAVRIEQHLLRPDNKTIEFLNLTQRGSYRYVDRNGWGFTVPNTSRLDVFDLRCQMNMALPDKISDWPSFISSQPEDLRPDKIDIVLSNRIDEMRMSGDYRVADGVNTDAKGNILRSDEMVMETYLNGWKVNQKYDGGDDENSPEGSALSMYSISPEMELTKEGFEPIKVKMYMEGYVINKEGSILTENTFKGSNINPFTLLKEIGAEQIVFVRNNDLNRTNFFHSNLDIVYTPDIVLKIAEELGPQLTGMMDSSEKSN